MFGDIRHSAAGPAGAFALGLAGTFLAELVVANALVTVGAGALLIGTAPLVVLAVTRTAISQGVEVGLWLPLLVGCICAVAAVRVGRRRGGASQD